MTDDLDKHLEALLPQSGEITRDTDNLVAILSAHDPTQFMASELSRQVDCFHDSIKLSETLSDSVRKLAAANTVSPWLQETQALVESLQKPLALTAYQDYASLLKQQMDLARDALQIPTSAFSAMHKIILELATPRLGEELKGIWEAYESRFTLPSYQEQIQLLTQQMSDISSHAHEQMAAAMAQMTTPWFDVTHPRDSIAGFTAIQSIGAAIDEMQAFDVKLSTLLRDSLGDWRDLLTVPESLAGSLAARREFYIDRGFDARVVDFPPRAFDASVEIAGLKRKPPPVVLAYGSPIAIPVDSQQERAFWRSNDAHDWLQRLESQLRQYIDRIMTGAHGSTWPKHRLPKVIYDEWKHRQQTAEAAGGVPMPLIAYADFTDYVTIVCRKDDWLLFKAAFQRMESFRESMQRLYPIRLATAHARPITQEDELLLYCEVLRLTRAMA
jgi:hypothetical protein